MPREFAECCLNMFGPGISNQSFSMGPANLIQHSTAGGPSFIRESRKAVGGKISGNS